MSTVTVEVKDVDGPNANGWYEITFDDGTKASTRSEEVAKAAFQSRDAMAEARITESTSGRFTNRYLNEINGVSDGGPKKRSGGSSGASRSAARTPAENDRIARQWAYGRATELLIGSGAEFTFPLEPEVMSQISEQAEALLNATKK